MSSNALPTPEQPHRFGTYDLLELLGEGAMAQVFRARQQGPMGFTKEVAIKRLRPAVNKAARGDVEALVNEARLGGQLRHPNIVEVLGCDVVEGTFFLAMEYVRGWTLDDVLWRLAEAGVGLPFEAVLDVLRQVAAGLAYAHAAENQEGEPLRLVHRDLKPPNIFLDRRGTVKLADFGLAKHSAQLYQTTGADVTKGSPLYMSPEQVAGEALDGRSDLFALGSIALELAAGVRPFEGSSIPNTLMKVLSADWSDARGALRDTAPRLEPIIERLLQLDRGDRYPDAGALLRDLDALAEGSPAGIDTKALASLLAGKGLSGVPADVAEDYRPLQQALAGAALPGADLEEATVPLGPPGSPPSWPATPGAPASWPAAPGAPPSWPAPAAPPTRPAAGASLAPPAPLPPGAAATAAARPPPVPAPRPASPRPVPAPPPPARPVAAPPLAHEPNPAAASLAEQSMSLEGGRRIQWGLWLAVVGFIGAAAALGSVLTSGPLSLGPAPPPLDDAPAAVVSTPTSDGIVHRAPATARLWGDVKITARVTEGAATEALCHYRRGSSWRTIPLAGQDGGRWAVDLPVTSSEPVVYWLEFRGGSGPRSAGSASQPYRVVVQ